MSTHPPVIVWINPGRIMESSSPTRRAISSTSARAILRQQRQCGQTRSFGTLLHVLDTEVIMKGQRMEHPLYICFVFGVLQLACIVHLQVFQVSHSHRVKFFGFNGPNTVNAGEKRKDSVVRILLEFTSLLDHSTRKILRYLETRFIIRCSSKSEKKRIGAFLPSINFWAQ